ncbi:TPA: molecular chaperone [Providencia stuartii]|nr:molecular chaperone [Providencia stuartii]
MSTFFSPFYFRIPIILSLIYWSATAFAGISLNATRLIISENDGMQGASIGVRSDETSTRAFLVKAQVFRDIDGQHEQVPFVVSPSLFRLEPGNTNQLRVIKNGGNLPNDKESVFYFRVAALPAASTQSKSSSSSGTENILNVATGNIIKLFYRPNNLPIKQKEAMGRLQFQRVANGIKVTNPTPYYITINSLTINGSDVNIRATRGQNMLPPYGDTIFLHSVKSGKIQWKAINDYGGIESFHGQIQ